MENVNFLKSILFPKEKPKKNHTFSCPREPKSHQNRAQTPSQTNFDDILRPKSFEETPWSDHMAVRTLPGTPKERPRGPQGPPRAAKAIFAPLPLGFDSLGDRRDLAVRLFLHFHTKVGFSCGRCRKNEDSANPAFRTPPRELRSQPACKACSIAGTAKIRHAWRDKRAADFCLPGAPQRITGP